MDRNTLPLWMTKADFCTSAENTLTSSAAPVIKRLEPSQVIVKETQGEAEPADGGMDWHDNWKAALAVNKAQRLRFDNVVDFSNHFRADVLKAVKDRGCTWKTITVREDGEQHSISFPYELALAYSLSKTGLRHLAPEWATVSPGCLKMENDSRLHMTFGCRSVLI